MAVVRLAVILVTALLTGAAAAQAPLPSEEALRGVYPRQQYYSPYAGRSFPTRVFWGETHLHTDFLVVADHSDNMGFFPRLHSGEPSMLADPTGRRWYDMIQAGGQQGVAAAVEIVEALTSGDFPDALASLPGTDAYRSAWEQTIQAAEDFNDPGSFTALIGYEWTSTEKGVNLHRVIVYRDGGDKASIMERFKNLTTLPELQQVTYLRGSVSPSEIQRGITLEEVESVPV